VFSPTNYWSKQAIEAEQDLKTRGYFRRLADKLLLAEPLESGIGAQAVSSPDRV